MIVLLDAGNSRYKWFKLDENEPIYLGANDYGTQQRAGVVIETLNALNPEAIVVASVLDDRFTQQLEDWACSKDGIDLKFVITSAAAHGVKIAYSEARYLGVDRWVAMVGAHKHFDSACIIVDCGTAVTIDALSTSGEHWGGVILPGIELMRSSLVADTKRINLQKVSQELPLFARDTSDGVRSGTLRAVVAAIDRITHDMQIHLNEPVTRILCGGDAEQLIPWLDHEYLHDPLLIARGLAVVATTQLKYYQITAVQKI